jgi:hypothetical protein
MQGRSARGALPEGEVTSEPHVFVCIVAGWPCPRWGSRPIRGQVPFATQWKKGQEATT